MRKLFRKVTLRKIVITIEILYITLFGALLYCGGCEPSKSKTTEITPTCEKPVNAETANLLSGVFIVIGVLSTLLYCIRIDARNETNSERIDNLNNKIKKIQTENADLSLDLSKKE